VGRVRKGHGAVRPHRCHALGEVPAGELEFVAAAARFRVDERVVLVGHRLGRVDLRFAPVRVEQAIRLANAGEHAVAVAENFAQLFPLPSLLIKVKTI